MTNQVSDSLSSHSQIAIGHIKSVTGKVVIISETGLQRLAEVGGSLFRKDKVLTQGAETVLEFVDGSQITLGDKDFIVLTEEVFSSEDIEQQLSESSTNSETLQSVQSKLVNDDAVENNSINQGATTHTIIERDFAESSLKTELSESTIEVQKLVDNKQQPLFMDDILTEDLVLFNSINQLESDNPETSVEYPVLTEIIKATDTTLNPSSKEATKQVTEDVSDIIDSSRERFKMYDEIGKSKSKLIAAEELTGLYKGNLKNIFIEDVDLGCSELGDLFYLAKENAWQFIPAQGFETNTLSVKLLVTVTDGAERDEIVVKYSVSKENLSIVESNSLNSNDLIEDSDGDDLIFPGQVLTSNFACSENPQLSILPLKNYIENDDNQYDV
ncbi:hypothetical protein H0A36_00635 [Endozoicomonas sp. SM1973]|uniref:Retention module-containing protein n=1 Tax=Spartinivicinus marinus TaxID=2994442 RepID=A0A853I3G4_9GAMM|nr:hypothetical protein [Spartinivicinus marinus]MCX4026657.1 hypothetical protein [Spartinivicinus marinus]NYZ64491.1 hypothetical protein [Spartinivicinus marinus]